jgi:hypothetical protein
MKKNQKKLLCAALILYLTAQTGMALCIFEGLAPAAGDGKANEWVGKTAKKLNLTIDNKKSAFQNGKRPGKSHCRARRFSNHWEARFLNITKMRLAEGESLAKMAAAAVAHRRLEDEKKTSRKTRRRFAFAMPVT